MRFRLFAYCFAAILLLAGCRKHKSAVDELPEDAPVPILVAASVMHNSASKAPVEKWDNTDIYLFGVKSESGAYDFMDEFNIVDHRSVIADDSGSISVYKDETSRTPYYYEEGFVYDFFGYHLGGADVILKWYDSDAYYVDVFFDGSNDLMYAETDCEDDMSAYPGNDLSIEKLYGATAARRGVHPKLTFTHALSRFVFNVQGVGENLDKIDIAAIEVHARSSGTLELRRESCRFIPSGENDILTPELESDAPGIWTGNVMVAPGMKNVRMVLKIRHDGQMTDCPFTVIALPIHQASGVSDSEEFLPGHKYDIFIKVYSPEVIEISAAVESWNPAGDFDVDPDDYVGQDEPPKPMEDAPVGDGDVYVGDYEDDECHDGELI